MGVPSTVGTTIVTFCSGASNATQATAQAAFATALTTLQGNAQGTAPTNVTFIAAGCAVTENSQAATFLYTYWALVQYVSAV